MRLPGNFDEFLDRLGQCVLADAGVDRVLRLTDRCDVAICRLGLRRFGLDGGLGVQLLLGDVLLKVHHGGSENAQIVDEVATDMVNHFLDLVEQRVVKAVLRRPADPCVSEAIEQLPPRMVLAREKPAVNHGRLQHRNLQATQQHLDLVAQLTTSEHEIEQHGHELGGRCVQHRDLAR